MEVQAEGNFGKLNYKSSNGYDDNIEKITYGLGLKFNLTKQKGMLPQTAFVITEKAYSNNHSSLFFKTTANFAWSYNLGKHFDLSGNILYSWSENDYGGLGLGLRLGYQFNEKFGLFSEWYMSDRFVQFSAINVGAWYKVTPRFLLSLNVGTNMVTSNDWKRGQNNYAVTVGVSFLLNNPNKKMNKKKTKKRKLRTY